MSKSNIEWTQESWNPVVGCSILSPGCTNCYAMKMAARIEAMNAEARETERSSGKRRASAPQYDGTTKHVNGNAIWTGKLALAGDNILLQPLKRKKPTTYFVNSMGDLFHENVPDEWIDKVFAVMALTPQHTYQVLTKRAGRMRDYLSRSEGPFHRIHSAAAVDPEPWRWIKDHGRAIIATPYNLYLQAPLPLSNVWLGVSTERQQEADERIPLLLQTPAAVRFISAEPLLGAIDLKRWMPTGKWGTFKGEPVYNNKFFMTKCEYCGWFGSSELAHVISYGDDADTACPQCQTIFMCDEVYAKLHWVITGGESGHDARPSHPQWFRDIGHQCYASNTAYFHKQNGEWIAFYDRDRDDPDWRNIPEVDNQMGRGATRWHNLAGGIGFHGERLVAMRNVGKKAAGRLLDGIEHNGMPGAA